MTAMADLIYQNPDSAHNESDKIYWNIKIFLIKKLKGSKCLIQY